MIVKPVSRWSWFRWLWWDIARWTRRRWNHLRGRRDVFYTMEIGATRLDPDGVVKIWCGSDTAKAQLLDAVKHIGDQPTSQLRPKAPEKPAAP